MDKLPEKDILPQTPARLTRGDSPAYWLVTRGALGEAMGSGKREWYCFLCRAWLDRLADVTPALSVEVAVAKKKELAERALEAGDEAGARIVIETVTASSPNYHKALWRRARNARARGGPEMWRGRVAELADKVADALHKVANGVAEEEGYDEAAAAGLLGDLAPELRVALRDVVGRQGGATDASDALVRALWMAGEA